MLSQVFVCCDEGLCCLCCPRYLFVVMKDYVVVCVVPGICLL